MVDLMPNAREFLITTKLVRVSRMVSQIASIVLGLALRSAPLSLAKTCSIALTRLAD